MWEGGSWFLGRGAQQGPGIKERGVPQVSKGWGTWDAQEGGAREVPEFKKADLREGPREQEGLRQGGGGVLVLRKWGIQRGPWEEGTEGVGECSQEVPVTGEGDWGGRKGGSRRGPSAQEGSWCQEEGQGGSQCPGLPHPQLCSPLAAPLRSPSSSPSSSPSPRPSPITLLCSDPATAWTPKPRNNSNPTPAAPLPPCLHPPSDVSLEPPRTSLGARRIAFLQTGIKRKSWRKVEAGGRHRGPAGPPREPINPRDPWTPPAGPPHPESPSVPCSHCPSHQCPLYGY